MDTSVALQEISVAYSMECETHDIGCHSKVNQNNPKFTYDLLNDQRVTPVYLLRRSMGRMIPIITGAIPSPTQHCLVSQIKARY